MKNKELKKILDLGSRLKRTTNFPKRSTYNIKRDKNKLGIPSAFFMLFKSCVSLGVFSYPYAYGKVGNIYGAILSILINYVCTYGMYVVAKTSIVLEDRIDVNQKISDYKSKEKLNYIL